MTCPDCQDTGYVMQDIGTATTPDFIEIRCKCNPEPTDFDYPADFDVVEVDYDRGAALPSRLLA